MGGKCVEIYQLRQFAAVAKTENMTRAAQSLSMAQPAVSKTIRNLESELGAELFERTGKGLRRTEQGDILLRYARAILNAELDARREIEEGSVHLLHIRDAECRRYIYVQQLSRFETHSMRAFRAFLRRYFSKIG